MVSWRMEEKLSALSLFCTLISKKQCLCPELSWFSLLLLSSTSPAPTLCLFFSSKPIPSTLGGKGNRQKMPVYLVFQLIQQRATEHPQRTKSRTLCWISSEKIDISSWRLQSNLADDTDHDSIFRRDGSSKRYQVLRAYRQRNHPFAGLRVSCQLAELLQEGQRGRLWHSVSESLGTIHEKIDTSEKENVTNMTEV